MPQIVCNDVNALQRFYIDGSPIKIIVDANIFILHLFADMAAFAADYPCSLCELPFGQTDLEGSIILNRQQTSAQSVVEDSGNNLDGRDGSDDKKGPGAS